MSSVDLPSASFVDCCLLFEIDLVIPHSGNSGLLALPRLSVHTSQEDRFLSGVESPCGFFFEPAPADCHFQQTT